MSRTLSSKSTELKARMESLHGLRSNMAEASELNALRDELGDMTKKYLANLDLLRLLSQSGMKIIEPATVASLRKNADQMLTNFDKDPKASTLKKGKLWVSLITSGDRAAEELLRDAKKCWQNYRLDLFGGDTPEALNAKLAKTEENQRKLRVYGLLFGQFKKLFDAAPSSSLDVSRAKKLAADLEEISQQFDYSVSPSVKAFLEAVQTQQGASISLLTEEVITWLSENNGLDGYRIKVTN